MIRPRPLLLLCLGVTLASPAAAQVRGRPIEFSGQAGYNHYDLRSRMMDDFGYGATLGWRAQPWLVLEGQAFFGPSHADTLPEKEHNFFSTGLDLRLNMRPAENRVVPYFLVGGGYGTSSSNGHPPEKLARGTGSIGLGMLIAPTGNQRAYLRIQVKDHFFREREALEFSNHFGASIGIHYVLGGKAQDSDLDGVRDWLDKCPATPIGAKVDANGCPTDADRDSVPDGIDKCDDTPAGCPVDKTGCSKDADGDGVCDGIDTCPDTPKGATVDAKGCPSDVDGDGVPGGIDQCNDSPKGCTVDAKGCTADTDGDGVCDGADQCANTPEGLRVDAAGCPIEVSEKEVELLDTGMIRLQNINFDTGKATLKPESFPVLEEVARILQQYPTLQIEIGGHTDNKGSATMNEKLSGDRAASVLDYLKQNFPQIASSQYTTKGYGLSQPIAPNTTELGRARNRRVEFKVLNTSALRIEREKRSFLRKGGGTVPSPAPTSTPPATPSSPEVTPQVVPPPAAAPSAPDTTQSLAPSPAPPDTTKPR
ncbi:MAG TPA: OmpA family protein [Candidatus Eisenbacteria bacterium]|nr:OmpA family protein [Candidatus Eisenbacteria bacterium]